MVTLVPSYDQFILWLNKIRYPNDKGSLNVDNKVIYEFKIIKFRSIMRWRVQIVKGKDINYKT